MIFLPPIAVFFIKVFGIFLLPWSIYIAIKEKRFKNYCYQVARGLDIFAMKLYEPVFNKKLGPGFGKDETISERMAFNKRNGLAYPDAKKWESILNKVDKNHLDKINLN